MYKAYSGTVQTLCAVAACRKTPAQLGFLRLHDKMVLGDERCWNAEKWIVVS